MNGAVSASPGVISFEARRQGEFRERVCKIVGHAALRSEDKAVVTMARGASSAQNLDAPSALSAAVEQLQHE
ncbi:hypothetical protein [Methylosinus sporium]|uniref:Uncharacterized protein n=1 Tax=Methylosinus sporium TaxID=428 RepID=A0A2U1SMI0_METSR|nr:hypothetical protein [Methylosinus sporium]PWB92821.1 hypothetical protein C5689_16120 [Methylosinus sporium]